MLREVAKYILDLEGETPYNIRTEVYDPKDPYGAGHISCGKCDKAVSIHDETKWKTTGAGLRYLDTVRHTRCCGKTVESALCPIVCIPCRRIALLITPHSNDKGFHFVPGREYHTDRCPECNGQQSFESKLLEQVIFNKLNGIPDE